MNRRRDLSGWIIGGAVAGLAGWLLFMTIHAALIVPIWDRGAHGLPFALLGGAMLAWGMHTFGAGTISRAVYFGLAIWLLLLPTTAVAGLLRLSGVRHELGDWDTVIDLAVAAITGYVAARLRRQNVKSSLVLALCMAAFVTTMAGPIPVTNSARATALFVAFLPIYIMGSVMVVIVRTSTSPRRPNAAETGGVHDEQRV